eukprot:Gb_16018 [translate_table: standard]
MMRSCFRPFRFLLSNTSVSDTRDPLLWHKELKQHASGHVSIAVVQANTSLEDQSQVVTSPLGTFIGVYDGHGGPQASRFISDRLFTHMKKFALELGGMSAEVLHKAFDATEEEFLHRVMSVWQTQPQIASVGSCCLAGVISNNMLYVANLGDSRAVLGSSTRANKSIVAERLSTEHNAAVEEVRKELKLLHPDDSHIVVVRNGVWRVKGIIQV